MSATEVAPDAPAPGLERLRSSRDVLATLRARHRATALVVVHARPGAESPAGDQRASTRIAVVASKKVGTAVRRNRAKRLLREAARRVEWSRGQDVVLVARANTPTAHLDDVVADLEDAVAHLGLDAGR